MRVKTLPEGGVFFINGVSEHTKAGTCVVPAKSDNESAKSEMVDAYYLATK